MKKILIFFLVLVVLLGGAVGAFFLSLDNDNYREQITKSAEQLLGRKMKINGDVSVTLLPTPRIVLSDVIIENRRGFGAQDLARIEKVEASVRFKSLLEHPLVVDKVTLKNADIFLQRNKEGKINWDFPFLKNSTKDFEKDAFIGRSVLDLPPQFKNIVLENASVSFLSDVSETRIKVDNINGDISSKSLMGPFVFNGDFNYKGSVLKTQLEVAEVTEGLSAPFSLMLQDDKSGSALVFKGQIDELLTRSVVSGLATMEIEKFPVFAEKFLNVKNISAAVNKKVNATAAIVFEDFKTSFNDVAVRYGEDVQNAAAGSFVLTYPKNENQTLQIDSKLFVKDFSVDELKSLFPSWDNLAIKMAAMKRKGNPTINLDFEAEKMGCLGQDIKNIKTVLNLKDGIIAFDSLTATLPEKTNVEVYGDLNFNETKPVVRLGVAFGATQLKNTLTWLGVKPTEFYNLSGLTKASGTFLVYLRETDFSLQQIDIDVDGSKMTGGAVYSLTDAKPTGAIRLAFENFDFGKVFSMPISKEGKTLPQELNRIKTALSSSNFWNKFNLGLTVKGDNVTLLNLPIQNMVVKVDLKDGLLSMKECRFEQPTLLDFSVVGNVGKKDGRLLFDNVASNLSSPKVDLLFGRLNIQNPLEGKAQNASVSATVNGTLDNLRTNLSFVIGDNSRLSADGTLDVLSENIKYDVLLTMSDKSFGNFKKIFLPDGVSTPNFSGVFNFSSQFKGTKDAFSLTNMKGIAGSQEWGGNLDVVRGDKLSLKGTLSSERIYLDKFFPSERLFKKTTDPKSKKQLTSDLLKFSALDGLVLDLTLVADKVSSNDFEFSNLSSSIKLQNGVLDVEKLAMNKASGKVSVSGQLSGLIATPTAKFHVDTTDYPLDANIVDMQMFSLKKANLTSSYDFSVMGNSFEDMGKTLTGSGKFSLNKSVVSGLNFPAFIESVGATLVSEARPITMEKVWANQLMTGEMEFSDISASFDIKDGILKTSDMLLKAQDVRAISQATFDLPDWDITSSMSFNVDTLEGFPSIPLTVRGNFSNPDVEVGLKSFIEYAENSAEKLKNTRLVAERQRQMEADKKANDERLAAARKVQQELQQKVARADEILNLAPNAEAQAYFVRAKDFMYLVDEIARKQTISQADLERVYDLENQINDLTNLTAAEAKSLFSFEVRRLSAEIFEKTRQTMSKINRIHQRISGVESVSSAYTTAFGAFALLKELKDYLTQDHSIEDMQTAYSQLVQASEIVFKKYEEISKFDVDVPVSASETTTAVSGTITRR